MLKKLILLFLVAVPAMAFAQEKTAYVDADALFIKMPEMAEVETKLNAQAEAIKSTMNAIDKDFAELFKKYQELPETTAASVRADMEKQLQQLQERRENYAQNSQNEFQQKQQELLAPLQQKLMQAIKDVGDQNNYTYIFDRKAMHYISPSANDISGLVKVKLGIKE